MAVVLDPAAQQRGYRAQFEQYIARSVGLLVEPVADPSPTLAKPLREQAWHVLGYALKVAQSWPTTRALLLALAPRMEREGFRHEWLPYLEEGVAAAVRFDDVQTEAALARLVGRLYRLSGDYGTARRWYERAWQRAMAAENPRMVAMARNELGYVARLQREPALAHEHLQAALALLDADDVERATSYSWLAAVAYDQMVWDEAARHYQQAHDIWRAAGDQRRAAWSLQNLGDTLRGAGRLDEAAAAIQTSIRLMGALHDPLNQAIGRMNLGIVRLMQEEHEQALALFDLAEAIFRQVQDPLQLAKVYHNMAISERSLGRWQRAEQVSQQAIRLWEKLGDRKLMVNSMDELGLAYEGQGRKEKAMALYRAGLQVLDELPPDPFQAMLREMLLEHFDDHDRS